MPSNTKKAAEGGSGAEIDVTEKLMEAEEKKLEEWKKSSVFGNREKLW